MLVIFYIDYASSIFTKVIHWFLFFSLKIPFSLSTYSIILSINIFISF